MELIFEFSLKVGHKLSISTLLNNLAGNVGSFIRYSRDAVRDDCSTFWDREKEFVVHPDVSGKHDAICYLQILKFENIRFNQAFAVFMWDILYDPFTDHM